ncbi:MAG: hypothetical protein CSA20_08035 [Deltaproteobacteria bacterium]|nr:MAG: hypothetical protein CSA20_08035 [Deltaproteobacteria bacterium]
MTANMLRSNNKEHILAEDLDEVITGNISILLFLPLQEILNNWFFSIPRSQTSHQLRQAQIHFFGQQITDELYLLP